MTDINIIKAESPDLIRQAKLLFREYAESLSFDLCFQDFDREMDLFPGQYTAPDGALFVAVTGDTAVGCIGVRHLENRICEMKRLYVRKKFRGLNAGQRLVEVAVKAGKQMNYRYMRLDTLPAMESANRLYERMGFQRIPPYRHNPIKGALFLELTLE